LNADILILGGTRFVGRALVEAAQAGGHDVTLFNRGLTDPDLFPDVETVRGDRTQNLDALRGRRWDVAIDVACYQPSAARLAAEALAPSVDRYVFVSTVSVYAHHRAPQMEDDEVIALGDGLGPGEEYGARKAECERIVQARMGDRALIARPGLIVGPHDPTDRFAYWPRRFARGGRVLAPGDPTGVTQFIDVGDLAGWMLGAALDGVGGVFNVNGAPVPMGHLLDRCRAVTGNHATMTWVPSQWLVAAGVDPWMGVPLWVGAPGWEAALQVDTSRAVAAGLTTRALDATIADTLAWDLSRGGPPPGDEGLTPDRERDLLARFDLHPPAIGGVGGSPSSSS
jgi:2'-hydroxyisoflavone reductase